MEKSETIGKLSEALSKFQGEVEDVCKDKEGYNNIKYGNLASLLKVVRPIYSKYHISVTQWACNSLDYPNHTGIETFVSHLSGEWMSSKLFVPNEKKGGQGSGTSISYARKYALAAALNVAWKDDDGSAEEEHIQNRNNYSNKVTNNKTTYTPPTLPELIIKHRVRSETINSWLHGANVSTLDDLSKEQVTWVIGQINGGAR